MLRVTFSQLSIVSEQWFEIEERSDYRHHLTAIFNMLCLEARSVLVVMTETSRCHHLLSNL